MNILFSIALLASSSSAPSFSLETVSDNSYAFNIGDFEKSQLPAVSSKIMKEAKHICGALTTRFGRYRYSTNIVTGGSPMIVNYRQRFQCIDPATDPYKPVASDWKPSPQDERDATAFVTQYLAVLARKDAKAGTAMLEPLLEVTEAEWLATVKHLDVERAPQARWVPVPVGWDNNPAYASHPGSYAFYRISGTMPGMAAACGEILIYRSGPGKYQVAQQTITLVTQEVKSKGNLTFAQIARACGTG